MEKSFFIHRSSRREYNAQQRIYLKSPVNTIPNIYGMDKDNYKDNDELSHDEPTDPRRNEPVPCIEWDRKILYKLQLCLFGCSERQYKLYAGSTQTVNNDDVKTK